MDIINMPISEVKPYHRNPRENILSAKLLEKAITKFGFLVPAVIDDNNILVTGHARYTAVRALAGTLDVTIADMIDNGVSNGLIENIRNVNNGLLPVVYATGMTPEQVQEFRVSDNKISQLSEWNTAFLRAELREIESAIGFTDREVSNILTNLEHGYTQEQIVKKEQQMTSHYFELHEAKSQYRDVICPHCDTGFQIQGVKK